MKHDLNRFAVEFDYVSAICHDMARGKGFGEEYPSNPDLANAVRLALIHSEISECTEALRNGNRPDDHLPAYDGAVVELADAVIRIMHMAALNRWPLAAAIVAKMKYNSTRPHKHGGKRF